MATDTVLCTGCGITLRPFMTRCPRCGAEREAVSAPRSAAPDQVDMLRFHSETARTTTASQAAAAVPALQQALAPAQTTVVPLDDLRRRAAQQEEFQPTLPNTVVMSPPDEVRRFPLFTRAQIILILVGLALLGIGLLIGFLLWSREKADTSLKLNEPPLVSQSAAALALPVASPTLDPSASPSPTPPLSIDDQVLFEEAKKVLAAYNPTGFARYKITVKDGVVTLDGSAEHQPEKEGATNVLRLLAKAKQIVNNLAVKSDLSLLPSPMAQPTAQPAITPASTEASLNPPSTNAALPANPAAEANSPAAEAETQRARQREAERLQREQEAARQREAEQQRQREADAQRQREAEAQKQREAETQKQREAEEAARRQQQQEEARRLEAERTPTRPRRAEPDALRSGTVAWSGVVDGVDEIVIGGGSAAVRHLSGEAVRDTRASFSAAVPRAPVSVKLLSTSGRGTIQIVQQPAATNGYTTIVRIDDSAQRGGQAHQFTLRWSVQ
ncbi:MAG: BON domain-containing protein [Acidobacteria bacterium]|nr:BON domain-containing protein [Acidobacteriota bacterium]MBI3422408.1 BON domain-containing protein [Acidobacteriota bacterium]